MTILNKTPFPLFLNRTEMTASGYDVADTAVLMFAGHQIVPVALFLLGEGIADASNIIRLQTRLNADAVRTTEGELRFEYAKPQLDVILDLAEEHNIRAWDAAAFIAQQVFPDLTVLDSTKMPVTTLDALPKHDGVNQRSFHGDSNFPLSVEPPAWFPTAGMPNVTFSGF